MKRKIKNYIEYKGSKKNKVIDPVLHNQKQIENERHRIESEVEILDKYVNKVHCHKLIMR